jgi:hypothetical protein
VLAAALATPPATVFRLDPETVAATTERTWTSPLATARAGHLAEPGVPSDQFEKVDVLLERGRVHGHALWIAST